MKVYVVSVVYRYPDEDGPGFIAGVYSSKEKAKEAEYKHRERARHDLDSLNIHSNEVDNWYNIFIEEFDVD